MNLGQWMTYLLLVTLGVYPRLQKGEEDFQFTKEAVLLLIPRLIFVDFHVS